MSMKLYSLRTLRLCVRFETYFDLSRIRTQKVTHKNEYEAVFFASFAPLREILDTHN